MAQGTTSTSPTDGFGGGWSNWINAGADSVGALIDTATDWEKYRNERDSKGQGQSDLDSAVVTDYNAQAANSGGAVKNTGSTLDNKSLIYIGVAIGGAVLIAALIRK
tara:strand:+ start:327 stop:647 length:321 start_codon:yes stop_codon:yes gene_type:complete